MTSRAVLTAVAVLVASAGCNLAFELDETVAEPADLDRDDDDVLDAEDNCPDLANVDQVNKDGDAIGDACDACIGAPSINHDEDFDERDDSCDGCPALVDFPVDNDGDGVGNACERAAAVVNTRSLFEPFVALSPSWQAAVEWATDEDDTAGPIAPAPPDDSGLARTDVTLAGADWQIDLGVIAGRRWKAGDRAGIVLHGLGGTTVECSIQCPTDDCGLALVAPNGPSSMPVASVPVVRLRLWVRRNATSSSVICDLGGTTRTATPSVTEASWSFAVLASPELRVSYLDLIE